MHLSPPVALAAVRSKVVVLLLLIRCWLLLPLWDSVIVLCFVVHYFVSIVVLQSSRCGRDSWLLCFVCLRGVSWLLCGSSSRCHGFVYSLWLWYFLIILTFLRKLWVVMALLLIIYSKIVSTPNFYPEKKPTQKQVLFRLKRRRTHSACHYYYYVWSVLTRLNYYVWSVLTRLNYYVWSVLTRLNMVRQLHLASQKIKIVWWNHKKKSDWMSQLKGVSIEKLYTDVYKH